MVTVNWLNWAINFHIYSCFFNLFSFSFMFARKCSVGIINKELGQRLYLGMNTSKSFWPESNLKSIIWTRVSCFHSKLYWRSDWPLIYIIVFCEHSRVLLFCLAMEKMKEKLVCLEFKHTSGRDLGENLLSSCWNLILLFSFSIFSMRKLHTSCSISSFLSSLIFVYLFIYLFHVDQKMHV